MGFSRRRLLRTGAATATAAGVTLVAGAAAHAADGEPDAAAEQEPLRDRETPHDLERQRANPSNRLGCPLGKGE